MPSAIVQNDEIRLIEQWVSSGALEGRAEDPPPPPRRASGWLWGEPDLVVTLPAYTLRADGPEVFRNFVVTISVRGTRYVRGLLFRPRSRGVHHANIRVDKTPASRVLDEADPTPGYEGLIPHSQIIRTAIFSDGHRVGRLRANPDHVSLRNDAALIYRELGRPDRALVHFEAVSRLDPRSPAAHYNEAVTLELLGREDEALAQYREAIRFDPAHALAHNALGNMRYRKRRLDETMSAYRSALSGDANLTAARCSLARALTETDRPAEAAVEYRLALATAPDSIACLINFAWLLSAHRDVSVRRPMEAVAAAEHAVALTNRMNADALDALGAACASAGRFDDAIAAAVQAVQLLDRAAAPVAEARARLELYRRRLQFFVPVPEYRTPPGQFVSRTPRPAVFLELVNEQRSTPDLDVALTARRRPSRRSRSRRHFRILHSHRTIGSSGWPPSRYGARGFGTAGFERSEKPRFPRDNLACQLVRWLAALDDFRNWLIRGAA